jgi:hypothetical protein
MNRDYIVRKVTILLVLITVVFGMKSLSILNSEEHKSNIVNEIVEGIIIDSSKTQTQGLLGGNIVYETAIQIGDEILVSNNKEIYYKTKDKIKEKISVEVKNNKNLNIKNIIDVK